MNFGSGSSVLGGQDPVTAAMLRRQTGQAGATAQVTPSSATFDPTVQPVQDAPQAPAPMQASPQPTMPQAEEPYSKEEIRVILKAMDGRMKQIGKMQELGLA